MTIAATTIGILGYTAREHRVIDMLGLCDSTVARHPQEPIAGIQSTWRERHYNAPYVLNQAPEYIVFSTGLKPSAPAEQAVMLYPRFLDAYRSATVGFYFPPNPSGRRMIAATAYRKVRSSPAGLVPYAPELAADYKRGYEQFNAGNYEESRRLFDEAAAIPHSNRERTQLVYAAAETYMRWGQTDAGLAALNYTLELDSLMPSAQQDLYFLESRLGHTEKARTHREYVQRLCPLTLPVMDSMLAARRAQ